VQVADALLAAVHPAVHPQVLLAELVVAAQRGVLVGAALQHGGDLPAGGDAEVQRGADALGGEREAVAGGVADEEDPVLGGGAQLVRDPVALVAVELAADVADQVDRGLLDRDLRIERADADADLVTRGERPAVTGAEVALGDPQLEVRAGALRVDLQPAAERGVRRLEVVAGGEDPAPAERVDDQRRAQVAAVGVHGVAGAALDLGDLKVGPRPPLVPQQLQQVAVVEGRPGPRHRPAGAGRRRVADHRVEGLADAGLEAHVAQPVRGGGAGAGLALADLVAVDDEHARAARAQLARDRQPGEAGTADEDVEIAAQRGALGPPLGGSDRHLH
jgi:hypothetical protein